MAGNDLQLGRVGVQVRSSRQVRCRRCAELKTIVGRKTRMWGSGAGVVADMFAVERFQRIDAPNGPNIGSAMPTTTSVLLKDTEDLVQFQGVLWCRGERKLAVG